jgi:preprotein translocase SecE subunit
MFPMPSVQDESVQDEKPMATNVVATGAGEPEDEKPSPRPPSPAPERAGGAGFFTIYKKGQGKWTRLGTVFAAAGLGVLTAFNMYGYLQPYVHNQNVLLGICIGFLAVFGVLVYWLTNKPTNVDFLIATDSEMKKVNWTTKGELMGSTRVVVLFLFGISLFLFLVDQVFELIFWATGVIKIEPWYVEDFRRMFHH